jgi:hypothetical protein
MLVYLPFIALNMIKVKKFSNYQASKKKTISIGIDSRRLTFSGAIYDVRALRSSSSTKTHITPGKLIMYCLNQQINIEI